MTHYLTNFYIFNNYSYIKLIHMYENHTIKCKSCGKIFTSKEHDTLCNECLKKVENIKF